MNTIEQINKIAIQPSDKVQMQTAKRKLEAKMWKALSEDERVEYIRLHRQLKDSLPAETASPELEKAAEEYARASMVIADVEKYKGFIAGAEWMAGQGVTSVVKIDNYMGLLARQFPCARCCVHGVFVETHGEIGDSVIVQIRKK